MVVRTLSVTAVAVAVAATSHAITFSNISTLGTSDGAVSYIGNDGINFSLADGNSINGRVKGPIDLHFTVTADHGFDLSSFIESPVGFARNQATVATNTSLTGSPVAGPFNFTTTAPVGVLVNLSDLTWTPLGGNTYLVKSVIDLTSIHPASGGPSIASLTQIGFRFQEQAVPEPASMAVIGIGIAGVLSRSRKRRSNS